MIQWPLKPNKFVFAVCRVPYVREQGCRQLCSLLATAFLHPSFGGEGNLNKYFSVQRNNTSSIMSPGRAYWAWGEYLRPLCEGNEELKELIFFLVDRDDMSAGHGNSLRWHFKRASKGGRRTLLHRKWRKPAPRYEEVWTWIQKFSRLTQNRHEVIVTRSCVTLRVR
jgi:hypothetical protein